LPDHQHEPAPSVVDRSARSTALSGRRKMGTSRDVPVFAIIADSSGTCTSWKKTTSCCQKVGRLAYVVQLRFSVRHQRGHLPTEMVMSKRDRLLKAAQTYDGIHIPFNQSYNDVKNQRLLTPFYNDKSHTLHDKVYIGGMCHSMSLYWLAK